MLVYPSPLSLSYSWNCGSMVGLILLVQICTGLCLTLGYTADQNLSFTVLQLFMVNSTSGFLLHYLHLNGATMLFAMLYCHLMKSLYYKGYQNSLVWVLGVLLLLLNMMVAFLGYVLPMGNMSFWGATVITSLFSVVPMVGPSVMIWIWGGFIFSDSALKLFFTLHFLIPFIIFLAVMLHLLALHQTGSASKLGAMHYESNVSFSFFAIKDFMNIMIFLVLFIMILLWPYFFADGDSYTMYTPTLSPAHITPEWYFLFAYTILRSVPNKLGGVVALSMSVLSLFLLPMNKNSFSSKLNWALCYSFIMTVGMLTYLGMKPVEPPFLLMSKVFSFLYFFLLGSFLVV